MYRMHNTFFAGFDFASFFGEQKRHAHVFFFEL